MSRPAAPGRPSRALVTTLARVVFLALVAATFGAFFVAQRLKGAPPVVQLQGQRWFSPDGDGRKDRRRAHAAGARVRHAHRRPDRRGGQPDPPARDRARDPPPEARFICAGTGARTSGAIAPDGVYRVRGTLLEQGRSVVNPKLITLDTTPPRPRVVSIKPGQVVGPMAPEMAIRVSGISRRSATRFRVIRTDAGAPQLVAKATRAAGLRRWIWDGRSGGKPVPAGVYVVQARVRDRAGNVGSNPVRVPFDGATRPARPGSPCARWPPSRPCARSPRARRGTSSSTPALGRTAGRSGGSAASGPCGAARSPPARRARCVCEPRAARAGST